MWPMIMIAIAVLIILLGIVAIVVKKKYNRPPDYYAFFVMGLIWTIFGGFSFFMDENYDLIGLFVMGLVFLVVGLVNRDKWKKNRRRLKDLKGGERILFIATLIVLGVLVLAGFVFYYLADKGIL